MGKFHFDEQSGTWYKVVYTNRYGSYAAQEKRLRRKLRFAKSGEESTELFEKVIQMKDIRQKNAIRKDVPPPTEQHEIK